MDYKDFELWVTDVQIEKNNGRRVFQFNVRAKSPAGERIGSVPTGYDAGEMRDWLGDWETHTLEWPDVMALGARLGSVLFPKPIHDLLVRSLDLVRAESNSLRLRLLLDDRLQHIPWEYILLSHSGGEATPGDFLGLMHDVSIARHQAVELPGWDIKASLPARMVVLLSSPEGYPWLNLGQERQVIEKALEGNSHVEAVFVQDPTLQNWLRDVDKVHLFHFAGHGDFTKDKTSGAGHGVLVFGEEDDEPALADAEILAPKLRQLGVRVAVLGACRSAQRDNLNVWSSVAAALLKAGLGAVVAMQHEIRDDTAIVFAGAFYKALFSGLPIDEAVANGRLAVFSSDLRGWGTPVLYLRAPDGVVFPEYQENPELQGERKELRVHVAQKAKEVHDKLTGVRVKVMKDGSIEVIQDVGVVGEDGEVIGADIGKLGSGNVDVNQKADTVSGGMTGVSVDELG